MLGLVFVLLLFSLAGAIVGAVGTGLFSLALISLALLLGAGAVGLTLQRPEGAGEDSPPAERETAVIRSLRSRRAQGGGDVSRAA